MAHDTPEAAALADLILRISQTPQLDLDSVSRLLRATPARAANGGNAFIDVYTAVVPEPSPVQQLELRVPNDATRPGQALLILRLRQAGATTIGALRPRLPPLLNLEFPRPGAPHGTPSYSVHEQPAGRLSVGYLPAEGDVVRELIFDRPAAGR